MKPQGADSYTIEIYAYLMFVYVWPSRVWHDCSLFRVMASRNLDFRVARKQIIALVIAHFDYFFLLHKVDIVKQEAKRKCLMREDLELELQALRHQMSAIQSAQTSMNIQSLSESMESANETPRCRFLYN